jgi:WS/DGAT/MGAT family acyltransferase
VPRLRERLVRPPRGGGLPYWAPDPTFEVVRHFSVVAGGGRELTDVAAELVCARLPADRPLWRACLVTGCGADGRGVGLVLVIHHVVADGLGGLAVLAALAVGVGRPAPVVPATAAPGPGSVWRRVGRGVAGLRELGLAGRPRLAARTSLNRPTGPRRCCATTGVPLVASSEAAHRAGGTVNDVVVAAIVGALLDLLRSRGEHPDALVVSVPISARRGTNALALGNQVGVRPLRVPAVEDDEARLSAVVALRHSSAPAPPASSAGPLGLAFRALVRIGVFGWFIDHQRMIHTFVSNVRGPSQPLAIAGHQVTGIVPVAVVPGNVGVSFAALSYDGLLGVTLVADPDVVPELEMLAGRLEHRLRALVG